VPHVDVDHLVTTILSMSACRYRQAICDILVHMLAQTKSSHHACQSRQANRRDLSACERRLTRCHDRVRVSLQMVIWCDLCLHVSANSLAVVVFPIINVDKLACVVLSTNVSAKLVGRCGFVRKLVLTRLRRGFVCTLVQPSCPAVVFLHVRKARWPPRYLCTSCKSASHLDFLRTSVHLNCHLVFTRVVTFQLIAVVLSTVL
jgi:hypothetical protein